MVKRCSSCCYTCCSEITLSGFDLPVFPQLYAFTEGLTDTSSGNPPQRLSRFTLRTERHVREDGRMFFVRLDLFKSESRSVAQLQVTVFTPVTMTSVSDRGTYTQEDFYFRYRHEPGRFAINNACARNAISFTPDLLIASGKTTSTVTNPGTGLSSPQDGDLMLASPVQSVPAVPAGAVGTAVGTVSVQLGVHSIWDTRTSHSIPVYVDGDQWMHNSNEVILQADAEIVGEKNTLTTYDSFAPHDSVEHTITPLSYTIACAATTNIVGNTRQYRFVGPLDVGADTPATGDIRVRLSRQPSCRYGGELQANIIETPIIPIFRFLTSTISTNRTGLSVSPTNPFVVLHDFTTPTGSVGQSSSSISYPYSWHTPKVAYYRDRLRRCANPPCEPLDEQDPDQQFQPIALPEEGVSLVPDVPFPEFALFRIYPQIPNFENPVVDLGRIINSVINTNDFVRFRWRCRLVGLQ